MGRARTTLGLLMVVTLALGGWSVRAIRRTAGRRATLVDGLTRAVPLPDGARVLVPWQPVADVDLAHTTLCFDETEAAAVLTDFTRALVERQWRLAPALTPGTESRAVVASNGAYRLRGSIEPARRLDCDGARKQVLLSVEAAPTRTR